MKTLKYLSVLLVLLTLCQCRTLEEFNQSPNQIEVGRVEPCDMMDDIIDSLKRKENPLVVLDEADKLTDQVLYFFISLYNQLEDHCGIILCATNYLEKRIKKGLRTKRKGYEEIYSRMGRKFVELQVVNSEDVAAVCVANGVNDAKSINRIVDDSDCDLRRVKRAVWALQKGGQQ